MRDLLAAFIRRDLHTQASYRSDVALQLGTVVFTLVLFFYVGELVSDTELGARAGVSGDYFAFVVIGLAALRIAQTVLVAFSSSLRASQTLGTFEALITAPQRPIVVILFGGAYELLRGVALALLTVVVALTLFGMDLDTDPGAAAFALLALGGIVAMLLAVGVVIAALTLVVKETATLAGLATAGIGLLSGVYFPLEVLPTPLEQIGEAFPLTWGVDALRAALLGAELEAGRVVALYGAAALLIPASGVVLGRALRRAKQEGTLAQY